MVGMSIFEKFITIHYIIPFISKTIGKAGEQKISHREPEKIQNSEITILLNFGFLNLFRISGFEFRALSVKRGGILSKCYRSVTGF
jgi:hypothetical protein